MDIFEVIVGAMILFILTVVIIGIIFMIYNVINKQHCIYYLDKDKCFISCEKKIENVDNNYKTCKYCGKVIKYKE